MPEIAFPLSSSPGLGNQESGGRLVNAYTDKLSDGSRARTVRRRVPGLDLFQTIADEANCRGFMWANGVLYVALADILYKITTNGTDYTIEELGELDGELPVTFAQNNAATPDLICVSENGAFLITPDAAPESLDEPELPQPNSVCRVGGYHIYTTLQGEIWASALNDVTIAADSFTTAQSKADTLLRGVSFSGLFYAFGEVSIEVYANAGTAPFPLAYVTTIPRGLKGQWAVAGFEDGWSNELIWAGSDNRVYQLEGYTPVPISTPDVERAIAGVADPATIEASVYLFGGHAIWSLSSGTWTWEYNLTTKQWHERTSYLQARWRASKSIYAFGRWLVGDRTTGKIFSISDTTQDEDGEPLIFRVESAPGSAFPSRVSIPRADFDFEVGVGAVTGGEEDLDPKVGISWSDNGGASFSSPVIRDLGPVGRYDTTVRVNRTGFASQKGRIWRLDVGDPVRVGLYGGTFAAEAAS